MKRRELLVYCAALLGSAPLLSGLSGCGDDDSPSAGSGGAGSGGAGTGGSGGGGTGGTGGGGTGGDSGSGATGGTAGSGGTGGDAGDVTDAGDASMADASMADASMAACESGAEATTITSNHGHTLMTIPQADINAAVAKQYHLGGPHMHDIDVTADHFAMLAAGNSVTITNSDDGHKHTVTISCA